MEPLPDWCEPLLDAQQMRAVDRWAIEDRGVASLELMERAGTGVTQAVERLAPDGLVAVICGKGNNGGDGLVVARLLRERGRPVTVLCVCDPDELSGDARVNLERLPGPAPLPFAHDGAAEALLAASAIVDALLGTGFQGKPHGLVAEAIEALRRASAPVLSVDVPSGVDASTGAVQGAAVQAELTVTLHAAKPGLWIMPGKAHVGRVLTVGIGIPRGAPAKANVGLIGERVLALLPRRSARSTKFTSGHVVVAGGSRGLMGAPAMAALASMRAGAGYVTACVPASQASVLDGQLMEVMTLGLPDEQGDPDERRGLSDEQAGRSGERRGLPDGGLPDEWGGLTQEGVDMALHALVRAGALALGPGLGRQPGAFSFAVELATRAAVPTLIDADGLNAHAGRLHELAGRSAPTVLTPHAGELARLLELDAQEVERERLRHVRAAAELSGAVVVLKGDDTLVAHPDGRVAVSPGGSPALATAGTGDVLSGAIAALLAQGLDAFAAAGAGVYLHMRAGREAARRRGGPEGVIATDVIAALPTARRSVTA